MANILGEGFDKEIIDQINFRQQLLGQFNNVDDSTLRWSHGKTAWLKLSSSVDVKGSSEIAKNNILFGGLYSIKDKSNMLRTGFVDDTSISTYSNSDFGFRPMPALMDANIDYLNKGSLRRAEINIKAYSKEQFEIINKIYMSVGYTLLLEWGNSVYLDKNGKVQNFDTFNTEPFNKLFENGSYQDDIKASLKKEITKYSGNYDGCYGKVSNFGWSLDDKGEYHINITLISLGDVIESLKVNYSKPSKNNTEDKNKDNPLIAGKDKSAFNTFLYDISIIVPSQGKKIVSSKSDSKSEIYEYPSNLSAAYNMKSFKVRKLQFEGDNKWIFFPSDASQYYISLGTLLEYMEKNINIFVSNNNSKKKQFINYDYDNDRNHCFTFPYQFSSSPSSCIIPFNFNISSENVKFDPGSFNFNIPNKKFIANVMGIEISLGFISNILVDMKDEEGSVSLIDFLTRITDEINLSLGGVNQLAPFYDDVNNSIKIIENAPLDNNEFIEKKEYAKFNIYGVSPSLGSFVTNINFKVSIPSNYSTMITIGAQSNGNKIGEDSTSISKFYDFYKLTDRINEEKFTSPEEVKTGNDVPLTPEQLFQDNIKVIGKILKSSYTERKLTAESLDNISGNNVDFSKYWVGNKVNENIIPAPFFLPFEMSLSMDGLGGMKIYEKFSISAPSDKILPDIYRDENGASKIDFLIKNISHKISNNKWDTDIKAYTVPAFVSPVEIPSVMTPQNAAPQPEPDNNDPAVINNGSSKVGSSPPSSQPIAVQLLARGIKNGRLPDNELVNIGAGRKLQKDVIGPFNDFANAALKAGFQLNVSSAYRDFSGQQKALNNYGSGHAATPGYSSHGWGLAFDDQDLYSSAGGSTNPQTNLKGRKSSAKYKWMSKNGPKFGWYNPWRLSDNAGSDEMWHWEYWGN